eukprot:Nk52_evm14s278 gene=Nk52_evmTU14s278
MGIAISPLHALPHSKEHGHAFLELKDKIHHDMAKVENFVHNVDLKFKKAMNDTSKFIDDHEDLFHTLHTVSLAFNHIASIVSTDFPGSKIGEAAGAIQSITNASDTYTGDLAADAPQLGKVAASLGANKGTAQAQDLGENVAQAESQIKGQLSEKELTKIENSGVAKFATGVEEIIKTVQNITSEGEGIESSAAALTTGFENNDQAMISSSLNQIISKLKSIKTMVSEVKKNVIPSTTSQHSSQHSTVAAASSSSKSKVNTDSDE